MKIVFDTEKNTVKVGKKTFGVDMDNEKQNEILSNFNNFLIKNTSLTDFDLYEEDSMWMSYRYCIGRHTIASHMRAGDIGAHCYGRMTRERSIFTAYDINREIEDKMRYGCGPTWHFPITSLNKIYTSAIDIYCQFVEDYNIKSKADLLKYKSIDVILTDNERGYKIETITWEEYLRAEVLKECMKYYNNYMLTDEEAWKIFEDRKTSMVDGELKRKFESLTKDIPSLEYFFLADIDNLFVWNDLVHLFDLEHHHKSILTDGSECEWYWTYTHDLEQREDGFWYCKEIGYKRIRVPVDTKIGSATTWIPDESIKEEIY